MQTINSREYKLMLQASKFKGDQDGLSTAVTTLWTDLVGIIVPHAVSVSGTGEVEQRRRAVRYLDTADHWLRANDYVFRERLDLDKDKRRVTLKFRHADRYISQDRDMKPAEDLDQDMKFEEDIAPPFRKVYSYSSNTVVSADHEFATLGDIAAIYPGLAKATGKFPKDDKLRPVGDFTAWELVAKGVGFQIRKDPELFAACSLTLWYADDEDYEPVVAEFSFKYEGDEADYSAKLAGRAYDAYLAMQGQLGDWLDPKPTTKTAFAYKQ
jgi:hypothetical protein